jgi:DNA-binding NarL/FixJ family response regulator
VIKEHVRGIRGDMALDSGPDRVYFSSNQHSSRMTQHVATTRIVIADDHPIFRDGLRRLLQSEQGFEIVGEAVDAITAVTLVRQHTPDILLLDLFMPYGGGIAALRDLAIDPPPTRIILLTAAIEPGEIVTAVHLGARGIITKDSATALLFKCIQRVIAGEYWLDRGAVGDLVQALVAAGVVEGASNREVADRFGLSPQTVKNHLSNIFDKLGVSNRLELALYAVNHQLFPGRREPPSRPPGSSR